MKLLCFHRAHRNKHPVCFIRIRKGDAWHALLAVIVWGIPILKDIASVLPHFAKTGRVDLQRD